MSDREATAAGTTGELDLELVTFVIGDDAAPASAVLAAAAQHGVLGAVVEQTGPGDPDVPPVVLGLPVDEAGDVLRLLDGQVVTGRSALFVVDEIAAALGAVPVWGVPEVAADEPADLDGPAGVLGVAAFSGRKAVDGELAAEVAGLVQSGVVLVPGGEAGWHLAVHGPPRDGNELQPWWGAQRPVVGLQRTPDALVLGAHLRHDPSRRGDDGIRPWELRQRYHRRVVEQALPTWEWVLSAQRTTPLVDVDDPVAAHDLDDEVRGLVLALQGQPDPAVLADALGLDAGRRDLLLEVLREPLTRHTPHRLVEALGLPAVVGPLLLGELDARSLPGAVTAEPHGVAGTFREVLLARPEGTGWLSRLRRLDHDRPGLSVLFIAGEVALGGAMAARALGAFGPPLPMVWAVVLGIGAALCALDAAGNAVLLAALRRRRRQQDDPRGGQASGGRTSSAG